MISEAYPVSLGNEDHMSESFSISLGASTVRVHRFGQGPRLVIAFHGFGESGESFGLFEELLGGDMTFYAPDLPLHGTTTWKEKYLQTADLNALVKQLAERHGVASFSLLGYSMGGKVALCLIPPFIGKLERVILAAPDGLRPNRIYSFVTRNAFGKLLFRYITYHPGLFRIILSCGVRFSLMNESIYKFVQQHMRDEKMRKLVFGSWNCMKKIKPDMARIMPCIQKYQLPVALYFGRYDRIFPPGTGDGFKAMAAVEVKITESGHQLMTPEVAGDMVSFLRGN